MRLRTMMARVVAALALQGCAGSASVINQDDARALQSLPLFNPDASARFTFYLACTGTDASCGTVQHAFSEWTDARPIASRLVEPGDSAFNSSDAVARQHAPVPYRLAVIFSPVTVPSFDTLNVDPSGATTGSGYTPLKVGYAATIKVFDAISGKLLRELPAHQRRMADYKSDANGYIRAEVKGFLGSLGPAHSRR